MPSPAVSSVFSQRVVIGVGDVGATNNPAVTLSTYALGSCVGVVGYDPAVNAGAMLHLMLPEASLAPEKARQTPAIFADTGLPLFFRLLQGLRVDNSRLRVIVVGGASILTDNNLFRIGERNIRATLGYLSRNGFPVTHADVGGAVNRTLHLHIGSGVLTVKMPDSTSTYALGG